MIDQLSPAHVLMAKFYVVDGVSYAASETAAGHFDGHGYRAMGICRALGFRDAGAKRSMTLDDFQGLIERKQLMKHGGVDSHTLVVTPLDHYLEHRGFDVQATRTEMAMARSYLVDRKPYTEAERMVGLEGQKGFAAMYSVFKLGGFRGSKDRGSMNPHEFDERCKHLRLT